MPGTTNLMADERILALIRQLHAAGKPTTAICAAPMVLAAAGVVDGVSVTSHPSVRDRLGKATVVADRRVVESDAVVTSQGPGTAIEFALALVRRWAGADTAERLAAAMLVHAPVEQR
jgi:4-methyl-5(b-hydroxyethyl)-thiazole monophosphate biosynthesis